MSTRQRLDCSLAAADAARAQAETQRRSAELARLRAEQAAAKHAQGRELARERDRLLAERRSAPASVPSRRPGRRSRRPRPARGNVRWPSSGPRRRPASAPSRRRPGSAAGGGQAREQERLLAEQRAAEAARQNLAEAWSGQALPGSTQPNIRAAVDHVQAAMGGVPEHDCRRIGQFELHHRHRNSHCADLRVRFCNNRPGLSPASPVEPRHRPWRHQARSLSSRGRMIRSAAISDVAVAVGAGAVVAQAVLVAADALLDLVERHARRPGNRHRPRRAPAASRRREDGSNSRR